ncbi:MAG: sugar ABC transporter substrate-binding protein [Tepidisphaeraceae bacterium]
MRHATLALGWLSVLALAVTPFGCGNSDSSSASASDDKTLRIIWAEWPPSDGLQQLSEDFTKETGIKVDVAKVPWSDYSQKVFLDFSNPRTSFDIVVGDSQWIGRGVKDGLYVELTDWAKANVDLDGINANALKYLCEYPTGSGKLYALPAETDSIGFVYRKDWFNDPKEKDAFKAKFGRELAPPQTWEEFAQVAEFFTRPAENRYGTAVLTGRGYDELTMGFQQLMWAWGGDWSRDGKVAGVVNSPESADALKFYTSLLKFGPPDARNLSYDKTMEYFRNNTVAMGMSYFAFFPSVANDMGDKAGFFAMPTHNGKRSVSLGGQGFSISAKTSPEKQEIARKFIAWFSKPETQQKWITKPAGFTANSSLLKSDAFAKANAYNKPLAESLDAMKDFYNVPEYEDLLRIAQTELAAALDGKDPKAALDALATQQEAVLKKAGLLK